MEIEGLDAMDTCTCPLPMYYLLYYPQLKTEGKTLSETSKQIFLNQKQIFMLITKITLPIVPWSPYCHVARYDSFLGMHCNIYLLTNLSGLLGGEQQELEKVIEWPYK